MLTQRVTHVAVHVKKHQLGLLSRRSATPVVILVLACCLAPVGAAPSVAGSGLVHCPTLVTTARRLAAVRPHLAVISVGARNRFGHPNSEALARLAEAGVPVWRTDQCGEIEMTTDGERLWVTTGSTAAGCRSQ